MPCFYRRIRKDPEQVPPTQTVASDVRPQICFCGAPPFAVPPPFDYCEMSVIYPPAILGARFRFMVTDTPLEATPPLRNPKQKRAKIVTLYTSDSETITLC